MSAATPQSARPVATNPSQRRSALDLARFIAAFGVVVAHVQASVNDWIGHLALALFLILTAVLAAQSCLKAGHYAMRARIWRLMLPWLFWCAVYWLVEWDVSDRERFWAWPSDPWSLFAGPSIHLWFLPFVMVAGLMVEPVARWVTSERRLLAALCGFAVLTVAAFRWHLDAGLPQPVEQWFFGLPVYLLGLLFGLALPMGRAAWVVGAMALVTAISLVTLSTQLWVWQGLAATLIFWGLWHLPIPGPIPGILGREAFGIYLMHPFFLLVIYKFFGPDLGWVVNSLLAFTMSWGASALLRRVPGAGRLI